MKRLLLLSPLALAGLLSSCSIIKNPPDFVKPSAQAIGGNWQPEKVSSSIPARGDVQRSSLLLLEEARYHITGSAAAVDSPLLPGREGSWKLVQEFSDLDPGSRPSWAIRFHPKGAKSKDDLTAFFVNDPSAPKLLFKRIEGGRMEVVKMRKVRYVLFR